MEEIKDLYSFYLNRYPEDNKELTEALDKLEECLGENYTCEIEDIIGTIANSSGEQGFIDGFRYAAALLLGGKEVPNETN